jgi:hypothetical protein
MGKYDPLKAFLQEQHKDRVPLKFAEIEALLGIQLPKSKRYPAWWSNNPSNNVMTKVWLDAGYRTEQVDIDAERLVFRRVHEAPVREHAEPRARTGGYPGFGAMRGTIKIMPGVDLTGPADPEWGAA